MMHYVNVLYYAQHPALKSVYGKDQSVIAAKLFSSYRTVFSTGYSRDSKTNYLNWFFETLAQKEPLTIYQYGVFVSFLFALSLSSVLGRLIHLYWTILEKKTGWVEALGLLKRQQVNFLEANSKQSGIFRDDQQKIMWNFQGSCFQALTFKFGVTQFLCSLQV